MIEHIELDEYLSYVVLQRKINEIVDAINYGGKCLTTKECIKCKQIPLMGCMNDANTGNPAYSIECHTCSRASKRCTSLEDAVRMWNDSN